MNKHARYGFPRLAPLLAGLALLGGCKTRWDRLDEEYLGGKYRPEVTLAIERTISSFRPGLTRREDIEHSISALDSAFEGEGVIIQLWNPRGRGWRFAFSKEGVLRSYSRMWRGFTLVMEDEEDSRDFQRWCEDRLGFHLVSPEPAATFTPGMTTQEQVVSIWGPCMRAQVLNAGGFSMCWGSDEDGWSLEFDPAGTLAAPPRHTGASVRG